MHRRIAAGRGRWEAQHSGAAVTDQRWPRKVPEAVAGAYPGRFASYDGNGIFSFLASMMCNSPSRIPERPNDTGGNPTVHWGVAKW